MIMATDENIEGSDKTPPFFANNNTKGKFHALHQSYKYIPLDYVKLQLINYPFELINNENLQFMPFFKDVDIHSHFAFYKNMKFTIYNSGLIYISGSLHKCYNDGKHNANDFDSTAFCDILETFYNKFCIMPSNLKIIGLEYGVNIVPPINTDHILNNVLQHKRIDFENNIKSKYGNYLQAKHCNYILKIYNKSKQYKLQEELMRIEVKQCNWSEYRKQGIYTLQDFIDVDKKIFVESLIYRWSEVVFYDPMNQVHQRWNKYSNVNFWRELQQKSNTTYSKHFKNLKEINNRNEVNIQDEISFLILEKVAQLTTNKLLKEGFINSKFNAKRCLLTGIDISNQRKDSFLLSHNGLYNLYNFNQEDFQRIRGKYLSRNWFNSEVKIQIKEIAHNIRNRYFMQQKKMDKKQLSMHF